MNDRQKNQNDILAHCIRHDSSGELHRGEDRIRHAERQERCLRRAMGLMTILGLFATFGLGYSVILLYELPAYYARILNHVLTVVGLASLTSLVFFAGYWLLCRHRLSAQREEVRLLALRLLADRSGDYAR
jgi:hypothetical protein